MVLTAHSSSSSTHILHLEIYLATLLLIAIHRERIFRAFIFPVRLQSLHIVFVFFSIKLSFIAVSLYVTQMCFFLFFFLFFARLEFTEPGHNRNILLLACKFKTFVNMCACVCLYTFIFYSDKASIPPLFFLFLPKI